MALLFRDSRSAISFLFDDVISLIDAVDGAAAITELQSQVSGIQAVVPTRDKVARADAILGYWDARNIFIPHPKDAPWVDKMVDEWIGFPNMQHDDEVDSMTQALQYGPSTVKAGISMFDISL